MTLALKCHSSALKPVPQSSSSSQTHKTFPLQTNKPSYGMKEIEAYVSYNWICTMGRVCEYRWFLCFEVV